MEKAYFRNNKTAREDREDTLNLLGHYDLTGMGADLTKALQVCILSVKALNDIEDAIVPNIYSDLLNPFEIGGMLEAIINNTTVRSDHDAKV